MIINIKIYQLNEKQGLSRMLIDIIKTFIKKLATQGHSFSKEQFRSLKSLPITEQH